MELEDIQHQQSNTWLGQMVDDSPVPTISIFIAIEHSDAFGISSSSSRRGPIGQWYTIAIAAIAYSEMSIALPTKA